MCSAARERTDTRAASRIEKITENIGGKPIRERSQLQLLQSLRVFRRHSFLTGAAQSDRADRYRVVGQIENIESQKEGDGPCCRCL
jgi:hypothetical protein